MCLFKDLRRDVIPSVSHFPTHRNHPTEDDHQGPSDGTLESPDDGSRDPEVKGHGRLMAGIVEVN